MAAFHAGSVVLITGASTGIGRASAEELTRRGYRVYGTSREPERHHDAAFPLLEVDVQDELSIRDAVARVYREQGRLDVLVNNAGSSLVGPVEETDIAEALRQLDVNFLGAHRFCREVLSIMRAQAGGRIVNVSSIGGRIGLPYQAFYSASKFALEAFSEALRHELHPFGIDVVVIEPGDVRTEISHSRERARASLTHSDYSQLESAIEIIAGSERAGADPDSVAALLVKILRRRRPRLRYVTGPITQRAALWAQRLVPSRMFEVLIRRHFLR